MKTLAEQLREFMDQVQATPQQKPNQNFDCVVTVDNWRDYPEDENEPYDDEVKVGVNYKVYGSHSPATRWEPEEHPELDITAAVDMKTGEDVKKTMSDSSWEQLEDAEWKSIEQGRQDARYDAGEQAWKDRRGE